MVSGLGLWAFTPVSDDVEHFVHDFLVEEVKAKVERAADDTPRAEMRATPTVRTGHRLLNHADLQPDIDAFQEREREREEPSMILHIRVRPTVWLGEGLNRVEEGYHRLQVPEPCLCKRLDVVARAVWHGGDAVQLGGTRACAQIEKARVSVVLHEVHGQ